MILSGQFASENDLRRFQQEAEASAKLDHPGIVPIYEIGEHDGRHYFSMKLISGGSLAEKLPELRKDFRHVARLVSNVARAVHHAHQRGILHRDLKPANILLDENEEPLVSDLGLAKSIQSESNLTHTGAVVGTPAYMPPEQAAAEKEITTAADIYSIGAILFEALTGRPPHVGESPLKTLLQVMEEDVVSVRDIDASIPQELELICKKCLEREPNDRYSSAQALSDDLECWLAGEPVSVRPPSLGESIGLALRSNLKSAMGSGLIGLVGGGLVSISMLMVFCRVGMPYLSNTSSLFPSEPHPAAVTQFHRFSIGLPDWIELVPLAVCVGIMSIGLFNVWLVRPKPGSMAFATGMVCGLVMNTVVYACFLGPISNLFALNSTAPAIRHLADVAVGTPSQRAESKKWIADNHPDTASLSPNQRSSLLAQKLYEDGVVKLPMTSLLGLLGSSLVCLLPSILGTTFGSRVFHEESRGRATMLYVEFVLTLMFLSTLTYLAGAWAVGGIEWIDFRWQQLPCFVATAIATVAAYRRYDWRLRLVCAVAWIGLTIALF